MITNKSINAAIGKIKSNSSNNKYVWIIDETVYQKWNKKLNILISDSNYYLVPIIE